MASLYYDTLGNLAIFGTSGSGPQPGWGLGNTGPFSNIQNNGSYWSGTEYALFTSQAWRFQFGSGYQANSQKFGELWAWAVRSGDIGVVPVPAAVWLFG